jgi:hypothetical protein
MVIPSVARKLHLIPPADPNRTFRFVPSTRLSVAMSYSLRLAAALMLLTPAASAIAGELDGSPRAVKKAHRVARREDYTFLRTAAQVREFVKKAKLERVTSSQHVLVNNVSFPYARPAVKIFIERLAAQYFAVTGERLVITSLTRPLSRQPRNASALSVHPTGMAVDLRIPKKAAHRAWLERTLLALEDEVVLDVTKERSPAHYHVAVFPREYEKYLASRTAPAN